MVGLLAFSGRLEGFLWDKLDLKPARKGWKRWRNKAVRLLVTTFSGTCGALAFSTPLAAWQFGSVSLIAPLSNLLCLWCVELVFTLGLTAAALGMAVPAMAERWPRWSRLCPLGCCGWPGTWRTCPSPPCLSPAPI